MQKEIQRLKKEFPHRYHETKIASSAWLAPGSIVMGDVWIGEESSIWFNSVVRADVNYIRIGKRTNVQDLSVVHVTRDGFPTIIGDNVTIGHSTIIHACTINDFALIGMGSVILDGAEIGDYVLLGAGSLVTQNMKIPSGTKAFGRPAKVVAELTEEERESIRVSADRYVEVSKTYYLK